MTLLPKTNPVSQIVTASPIRRKSRLVHLCTKLALAHADWYFRVGVERRTQHSDSKLRHMTLSHSLGIVSVLNPMPETTEPVRYLANPSLFLLGGSITFLGYSLGVGT